MPDIPGTRPVPVSHLTRAQDRLTFLYLEHCVVNRDANAITAQDTRGTVHIPAATLGALLLGPGTTISQQAMVLLAESGSTAVWVGEHGVRYYAHGRTLTHSSRLLERQAALVSNQTSRLRVARRMYAMRFPDENTSRLTMQQLRGREGARVRRIYRAHSHRTGVPWERHDYNPADFDDGTRSTKPCPRPTPVSTESSTRSSSRSVSHLDWDSSTPGTSAPSCTTSPTCTKPRSPFPLPSTSPPVTLATSARQPGARFATG